MNKLNPGCLTILPADLFTLEKYEIDNTDFDIRTPWAIPKILGVCNAGDLFINKQRGELAIMFERKDGTTYWHHSGSLYVYNSVLNNHWGFDNDDIKDLFDKLHLKDDEEDE